MPIFFNGTIIIIKDMGGTTSLPTTTNIILREQSESITLRPVQGKRLIIDYQSNYQAFVKKIMGKQSKEDSQNASTSETLFLQSKRYYQRYGSKQNLKSQVKELIFSFLLSYLSQTFCIALSKEIFFQIENIPKKTAKEFTLSNIHSRLALSPFGALYKINYQLGFGLVKVENEEFNQPIVFYGVFCALSAVNIKQKAVQSVSEELSDLLDKFNLQDDSSNKLFRLLYYPNKMNQYYLLKNQKKEQSKLDKTQQPSKLEKIGKKAFQIVEKIALAMAIIKPFLISDDDQKKEHGQVEDDLSAYWMEQMPKTEVSPLWRVGLITAKFRNKTENTYKTYSFTGTVIDDFTIITSSKFFRRQYPTHNLESVSIKLPHEKQSRQIDIELIDIKSNGQNKVFFLFLTRPITLSHKFFDQMVMKYIQNSSTLSEILDQKIYMCGYSKNAQKYNQYNQASKIILFDQTHFIEAFKKNQYSVGAPIYYVDEVWHYLIGICHSQDNIEKIMKEKETLEISQFASQFPKEHWIRMFENKQKIAKAKFNLKSANIKALASRDSQAFLMESLIDHIIYEKKYYPSIIHTIAIIKIANNFGVEFGIGVVTRPDVVITLKKYVQDKSKIITVFIKKFLKIEQDPMSFDLSHLSDFNIYWINNIGQGGHQDLSALRLTLKNDQRPSQKTVISLTKEQLNYLHKPTGFLINIDKERSNNNKIFLKLNQGLQQNDILLNEIRDSDFAFAEGLLFAFERKDTQYFYGFYKKSKTGTKGKTIYINDQIIQMEAISLTDQRRVVTNVLSAPYSYIGIIISKFNNCFRVGTCSFIKSKNKDKIFLITCAHNLVYVQGEQVKTLTKAQTQDNLRLIFGNSKAIQWTFQAINNEFFKKQSSIDVLEIHIHQQYMKQFKARISKQKIINQKQFYPENFFDIAVIEIKFRDQKKSPKGFIMKQQPPKILQKKFIQISGYPAQQTNHSSNFGVLYTESIMDHPLERHQNCYKILNQASDTIIQHKLSTLAGNSGSPIFYPISKENEEYALLGIHIVGVHKYDQVFNLGSYLYTSKIMSWLKNLNILSE